uniref:Uncharacterized protein n=1 Tax=viral metagenome TaxID=1070528 RepID=A0A6M3K4P4_9ZZZZ
MKTNLDSLREAYNESMGNIWGVGVKIKAKLDVGNNLFRFAPQHPNMKLLYHPVKAHSFVGGVKTNHCLCTFETHGHCVICERGQELLQQGSAEADKLQASKKFLYNVVYLGNGTEQPAEVIKKVQKEGIVQLMLGILAHNDMIKGMVYGGVGDITDLQAGCTANIYREGTEWNNTKYHFYPLQAKPVPPELLQLLSNPPDIPSILQYHSDEDLVRMLSGQPVFFPAVGQQQIANSGTPNRQPAVRQPVGTLQNDGQTNTVITQITSPF